MKIVPNKIIIILALVLLQGTAVLAAPDPPPPSSPPPPPGLPLDGGIFILTLLSIVLGIYKLYKIKHVKKLQRN